MDKEVDMTQPLDLKLSDEEIHTVNNLTMEEPSTPIPSDEIHDAIDEFYDRAIADAATAKAAWSILDFIYENGTVEGWNALREALEAQGIQKPTSAS